MWIVLDKTHRKVIPRTHRVIPELGHDCLHGIFVFFEKSAQLLVLL